MMTPTQSILRWATAVAVTLAGCAPSAAAAPETSATVAPAVHAIEWRPHTVEGGDGETLEAELGTLGVPENRSDPETETLTLHMVRLESSAERPAAPIVYLSGGPGASGIAAARWLFDTFKELTRTADVILLDQRGTGQSDRGLLCMNPDAELDPDLFNGDGQLAAAVELAATCRRDLEERSIDLAGYTTSESADDLDDLRRALGVPSISLLGFSYGTHLGLETIRRHGRHLERVVLIGAEGPDHTRKLPLTLDTQLRKLSLLAARQPAVAAEVPDMYALLLEVLAKLEKEPIPVPLELPDGAELTVPVNAEGLQTLLSFDLGDASDFPFFPALLRTIDQGDPSLLAWFVRKRFGAMGALPALFFAVDGASGATPERRLRIEREAKISAMGDTTAGFFEVAEALGVEPLGETFRRPIVSDVETLFVSGSLDSNTPPYQAEEMRWGLPRSSHLVIENAGHEDMLGWHALTAVLVRFFSGDDVSREHLARQTPRFLTVAEAKAERLGE